MALQNFQLISLGSVLEKKLQIPEYQREYAWDKGEVEDLWEDLEDTFNSEKSYKHFLGQVVVHSRPDSLTIIDGQQRITTCAILMSCFVYSYKELYDSIIDKGTKEAQLIYRKIIEFENKIGIVSYEENYLNQKPNLMQNESDNEFFIKVLMHTDIIKKKQTKKSQERMRKACNYFSDSIKNLLKDKDFDSKKELIEDFSDTLINRFQLMYIEATELDEAFTIFETLNARGKDLASADLLKNHLFTTGKDVETSNHKWNKILDTLDELDMTKFIRSYWNSRNDFIREKVLYKTIAAFVRNKKQSKDFLDELGDCCPVYHDLAKPDVPQFLQDANLIESLKGLNTLQASSFYPILLAMSSRKDEGNPVFTEKDMAKVARTIESYVFRNAAICGQTANTTELYFAAIAKDIYNEELTSLDEICDRIKDRMVSDEEFKNSFLDYSTKNKERIRYIFRKIHNFIDPSNELNLNSSEVHIEHIMPEDNAMWPEISDEDHDEYLWHLGNLCLLSGAFNISISNKPFNDKKNEAYSQSKIEPNNKLVDYDVWNVNSIKDRQEKLFDYALLIWPR